MKEKEIAKIYASSLYKLGEEQSVAVVDELTRFQEIINSSNDLESLLFLDIFTIEEKTDVVNKILEKVNFHDLTRKFLNFLFQEKRMSLFPIIYKELIVIDDHKKGFLRGVIEGNDDQIDESLKSRFYNYLKQKINKEIQLDYQKNSAISAGYKVTVEDLQLDASVDNQLEHLKKSVLQS